MKPSVTPTLLYCESLLTYSRSHTAIPGGADRAMTASARLRVYVVVTAILGGVSAGLVMFYRSILRPGGLVPSWPAPWASWLLGIRDP